MLWLKSNILNKLTNTLHYQNFYAPLTIQVEDLDQTTDTACSISHIPSLAWQYSDLLRLQKHVNFDIPAGHTAHNASDTKADFKQGVLNGSISSAAWDIACTFNAGIIGDLFIQTIQTSIKNFSVPDGHCNARNNSTKLHHLV